MRAKSLLGRAVSSIAEVRVETWLEAVSWQCCLVLECVWFCGSVSVRLGDANASFEPCATITFGLALPLVGTTREPCCIWRAMVPHVFRYMSLF